jgi:hypothetical protein
VRHDVVAVGQQPYRLDLRILRHLRHEVLSLS